MQCFDPGHLPISLYLSVLASSSKAGPPAGRPATTIPPAVGYNPLGGLCAAGAAGQLAVIRAGEHSTLCLPQKQLASSILEVQFAVGF